jgi:chromosomal replication initiator protein
LAADFDDSWHQIRLALRDSVGDRTFELWLAPLRCLGLDGETLVLDGPPEVAAWARARYTAALRNAAAAVLAGDVAVAFAGDEVAGERRSAGEAATDAPSLNPKYTFEQFVIGPSNRMAHAAALAVAEAPTEAYNPLFIYGPPGLGKTHLLHAIANYIRSFDPGLSVRYVTAEAFTNAFLASLRSRSTDAFKAHFRDVTVLLVDDVQFFERKARSEEEMFHTFNALYEGGRQLVVTCDRLPTDLGGVEARLRDRFAAGLITDVSSPDPATRLAILHKRAAFDGVPAADDALALIASAVTSNVRALEGALIRAVALASLESKPLDATLVKESLARAGSHVTAHLDVTIEMVQEAACAHFRLPRESLLSRTRKADVAWARQVAMYLSRELTDHSLPHIAREFSGRDHTTVLHACKRVSAEVVRNAAALRDVEGVTALLKPAS